MSKLKFFITGTDTGVGKTFYTCRLLEKYNGEGYKTIGLKPVASDCNFNGKTWVNEDALLLQKAASYKLPYHLINPIALRLPVSPHLAALDMHIQFSAHEVLTLCQPALESEANVLLVEGVGGWLAPLNNEETMTDFAIHLQFPVILVVGMRLGCLNHALLTYYHILQSGLPIAGWVANCIDPNMLMLNENIETLRQKIKAPLLDILSFENKWVSA